MITKLSSGNYDIISSGCAFFYTNEFRIELYTDEGEKDITVVIDLIDDNNAKKPDIKTVVIDDELHIKCVNLLYTESKNGIIKPVHIAQDENTGKKLYFIFYIQREGNVGCTMTNSIKYTIFKER